MKTYNLDSILDLTGNNEKLKNMVELQKDGIEMALNILEKKDYVLIADDVGMGKTYEGLGIAFYKLSKSLGKGFNILIVAPSNEVAKKWEDELKEFIPKCWKRKNEIIEGNDKGYYFPKIYDENKLKLRKQSEIDSKKNYISIINLKKFSYIKFNENDIDDEIIINQLKEESKALPNFDLVIIDESQNLRRHESKKSKFFSTLFGLEKNGNSKFKKVVLLSATPNHSCKNDILSQVQYFDPDMTEDKINTKIISNREKFDNNIKEGRFIIKRQRKYDGKNKYEFRDFEDYNTDDMNFLEMLTMSLIQKRQIKDNKRCI